MAIPTYKPLLFLGYFCTVVTSQGQNPASTFPVLGSLVCPEMNLGAVDNHFFSQSDHRSCPKLVVQIDSNRSHRIRLVDGYSYFSWALASEIHDLQPSQLQGKLCGALAKARDELLPTQTPGVMRTGSMVDLVLTSSLDTSHLANVEKDTIALSDTNWQVPAKHPATSLKACLDTLTVKRFQGLIPTSILPANLCQFRLPLETRPCKLGLMTSKAIHKIGDEPDWIFSEMYCGDQEYWGFRSRQDTAHFLHVVNEYVGETKAIEVVDMNADMAPEFILETEHYFGDGLYSQLQVVSMATLTPVLTVLPLGGESGEPSGGTATVDWWLIPGRTAHTRYLCVSRLMVGNEGGENSDLMVTPYVLQANGKVEPLRDKGLTLVFFGKPGSRKSAEQMAAKIATQFPESKTLGLRVLPKRVNSKVLWISGILGTNRIQTQTFSKWSNLLQNHN